MFAFEKYSCCIISLVVQPVQTVKPECTWWNRSSIVKRHKVHSGATRLIGHIDSIESI